MVNTKYLTLNTNNEPVWFQKFSCVMTEIRMNCNKYCVINEMD